MVHIENGTNFSLNLTSKIREHITDVCVCVCVCACVRVCVCVGRSRCDGGRRRAEAAFQHFSHPHCRSAMRTDMLMQQFNPTTFIIMILY